MSYYKSILVISVLGIFTAAGFVVPSVIAPPSSIPSPFVSDPVLSDYVAHAPILIEDSTNKTQFESLGFPGNGTLMDPFIINGLSIDGSNTDTCIEIRNPHATSGMTSCYFVIRDCYLYNGSAGVLLWDATVGVIEYNIIVINSNSDSAWPIHIVEDYTEGLVYNLTIGNNHLTKNHDYNDLLIYIHGPAQNVSIMNNFGIGEVSISVQLNALVFNNTFLDFNTGFNNLPTEFSIINNSLRFVNIDTFSPNTVVEIVNNSITDGLKIKDSENCSVHGNDIFSSTTPIRLENADNITFTNNVFYGLDERYNLFNTDSASENNSVDYNFYSDYNGVDENDDNIGDTPHFVDSGLTDYHPLMSLRGFEIGVPVTSITLPTSSTSVSSTSDTTSPPIPSGTQIPPFVIFSLIGGTAAIAVVVIIIVVIKKK